MKTSTKLRAFVRCILAAVILISKDYFPQMLLKLQFSHMHLIKELLGVRTFATRCRWQINLKNAPKSYYNWFIFYLFSLSIFFWGKNGISRTDFRKSVNIFFKTVTWYILMIIEFSNPFPPIFSPKKLSEKQFLSRKLKGKKRIKQEGVVKFMSESYNLNLLPKPVTCGY